MSTEQLVTTNPPRLLADIDAEIPEHAVSIGDLILIRYQECLDEADRSLAPELLIVLGALEKDRDRDDRPAWRDIKVLRWSEQKTDPSTVTERQSAYRAGLDDHHPEQFMEAFEKLVGNILDLVEAFEFGGLDRRATLADCIRAGAKVYLHPVPAAVRSVVLGDQPGFRDDPRHAYWRDGYNHSGPSRAPPSRNATTPNLSRNLTPTHIPHSPSWILPPLPAQETQHEKGLLYCTTYEHFVKTGDRANRVMDGTCGICLDDYEEDQTLTIACLPCDHCFHWDCLMESVDKGNTGCPACRIRVSRGGLCAVDTGQSRS